MMTEVCNVIHDVVEKKRLTFLRGYLDKACEEAERFKVPAREEDVRDFLAAFCIVNFILHPSLARNIANDRRKMIMWRRKLVFCKDDYR